MTTSRSLTRRYLCACTCKGPSSSRCGAKAIATGDEMSLTHAGGPGSTQQSRELHTYTWLISCFRPANKLVPNRTQVWKLLSKTYTLKRAVVAIQSRLVASFDIYVCTLQMCSLCRLECESYGIIEQRSWHQCCLNLTTCCNRCHMGWVALQEKRITATQLCQNAPVGSATVFAPAQPWLSSRFLSHAGRGMGTSYH